MEIYVKMSFTSIFLVFKHDFIRCVDFTRIAASNIASDDVTNLVTHRIFNTDLLYSEPSLQYDPNLSWNNKP